MNAELQYDAYTIALAKAEVHDILIHAARVHTGGTDVSDLDRAKFEYSDLVSKISVANFEPDSPILENILVQISKEEYLANRGMLSALVVDDGGDVFRPRERFFRLAYELGIRNSDPIQLWREQADTVCKFWSDYWLQVISDELWTDAILHDETDPFLRRLWSDGYDYSLKNPPKAMNSNKSSPFVFRYSDKAWVRSILL